MARKITNKDVVETLKKYKESEKNSPKFSYPRNLYNDRKFSFILKIWNKAVERIMNKNV